MGDLRGGSGVGWRGDGVISGRPLQVPGVLELGWPNSVGLRARRSHATGAKALVSRTLWLEPP